MISRLITTKQNSKRKLNEVIDVVNALVRKNMDVVQKRKTLDEVPRKRGGGSTFTRITWARVIRPLSYPDPSAEDGSIEFTGRSYYICRDISNSYTVWAVGQVVAIDDHRTYDDILYKAKIAHTTTLETRPDTHSGYWEEVEEIKILYAWGYDNTSRGIDLRDCVPWFEKGEIIPLCKRTFSADSFTTWTEGYYILPTSYCKHLGNIYKSIWPEVYTSTASTAPDIRADYWELIGSVEEGVTRYYINTGLVYAGTEPSLRYNDSDKRTMAVFA